MIIFYKHTKDRGFLSKLIMLTQKYIKGNSKESAIYTHTEIVLGLDRYGAVYKDGVRKKSFSVFHNPDNNKYIKLNLSKEQETKAIKFLDDKLGLKYDSLGILLAQIIPLKTDLRNAYFCSELIAEVLIHIGYLNNDKDPSWYSPARLYEGVLNG